VPGDGVRQILWPALGQADSMAGDGEGVALSCAAVMPRPSREPTMGQSFGVGASAKMNEHEPGAAVARVGDGATAVCRWREHEDE
jgi:hypothetical protein